MQKYQHALDNVKNFLGCSTPQVWIDAALVNLDLLLIDHAQCEKKAAAQALRLIHQYSQYNDILLLMSRLAREELRHFEQVLEILQAREITFYNLSASRYAKHLHQQVRVTGLEKLVDTLIIGAFIEARSCERFAALAPYLEPDLQRFYTFLLRSESRHYRDYLQLAQKYGEADQVLERIAYFRSLEQDLILSPDQEFRFHSGVV